MLDKDPDLYDYFEAGGLWNAGRNKLDPKNFIGRVELNADKDDLFLDESPEEEREFMVCVGGPKLGELYDQLTSGEISEDEYRLKKDSIVYEFEKKLFAKKR